METGCTQFQAARASLIAFLKKTLQAPNSNQLPKAWWKVGWFGTWFAPKD